MDDGGYDQTSAPNPECPRCNGDGIGLPFFADTRKLAPDAALAYSGVKLGKNSVEITAISRERIPAHLTSKSSRCAP